MSQSSAPDATPAVAGTFTSTATDYDGVMRHNVEGAWRLIASIPPGSYPRVLDVGCGTGWASLAMYERFRPEHITGVDPAQGMLDVFCTKAVVLDGVQLDLRAEEVMSMGVEPESFDAVISSMAMHWFPDKPGATAAMAAALRPGGVLAILCSGRGGDEEYRDVLRSVDPPPPPEWDAAYDLVLRDGDDMEEYLLDAGLEPVDIWMERRVRHATPEAYQERMRVVASHITAGLDEEELAGHLERIEARMREVSTERGFRYCFNKLFAVAHKPV